jgi:hypothetical protein
MFFELKYIIMLEIKRGSGSISQYWSKHCRRCIPSLIKVPMIREIERVLALHAPLNKFYESIDLGFRECSVKSKLSEIEIGARLEGAPRVCDLRDRNRFQGVFAIVVE